MQRDVTCNVLAGIDRPKRPQLDTRWQEMIYTTRMTCNARSGNSLSKLKIALRSHSYIRTALCSLWQLYVPRGWLCVPWGDSMFPEGSPMFSGAALFPLGRLCSPGGGSVFPVAALCSHSSRNLRSELCVPTALLTYGVKIYIPTVL